MEPVAVLLRWLHIVPAVIAGGATVYAAVALIPAMGELDAEVRRGLREKIAARWRPVVGACIGLLIASGLTNFFLFQAKAHHGQPLYHALFGVKFLAALGVFFIAEALVGRSAGFQRIRDNAAFWSRLGAALVLLILLVSGVLRNIPVAS